MKPSSETGNQQFQISVKHQMENLENLVTLRARPKGSKAPFGTPVEFSLQPGSCVELKGPSGRGKTTIATCLTGIHNASHQRSLLRKLQLEVDCDWDPSIPTRERCGVLFQQTTLLDELTVAGNLAVALKLNEDIFSTPEARDARIKQLLDTVGLNYGTDAHKFPSELSGGMGRRVCLALQLAQHKRVIVLDEPFTGLDAASAVGVAKELVRLRKTQNTALLLISHEPHLSKLVHAEEDEELCRKNCIIELEAPFYQKTNGTAFADAQKPSLFGTTFFDRFCERLLDYIGYSLPLILMAFVACGLAISMLSADLLQRLDISTKVLDLVDVEVRPLIKMLTGEEASAFQMMGIRFKVNSMLNQTVPPAKATLYAIGLAKLFVLEVGPLLTALLLCGRIGGSYAGKVGTMEATNQNKLLRVLGVNPRWWTLVPSAFAAVVASPILTSLGTFLALTLGGMVGPLYGMNHVGVGDRTYWRDLQESIFPVLRLKSFEGCWTEHGDISSEVEDGVARMKNLWEVTRSVLFVFRDAVMDPSTLDLSVSYKSKENPWRNAAIELATYPPIYHILKAEAYILIILGVAEWTGRCYKPNLTPRGVPSVITFSVVMSGLLVILADWGFSQLLMLRE